MTRLILTQCPAYLQLKTLSETMSDPGRHLKYLIQAPDRLQRFSRRMDGFFYDFSRQRLDEEIFSGLVRLAGETEAVHTFSRMTSGDKVNTTEKRAALHTAVRDFTSRPAVLDGIDVKPEIRQVNQAIHTFSEAIHGQELTGAAGKAFTDAVVVGIGGSYLGCEFVFNALRCFMKPRINLHFLANVDIDNFGQVIQAVPAEICLWIVISKSYTTTETMANLEQVLLYLKNNRLDPSHHLVTVTAKGSPGDDPANPVLRAFHMFDFIGGRYSVSSAVGGVPLSLAFGYDVFKRFLKGCHDMDRHALSAPVETNMPLTAALISIWNSHFLGYPAQALIPYSSALSRLAPHIQQLYMESLGKGATGDGRPLTYPTGVIIFGEPGTNAQHSFFQLAHQGSPFPVEFIGVIHPAYARDQAKSKGVTNHQELWANMIAQAQALAKGREDTDHARHFTGNRPSSTILINDLSPESIGMLLSFYEARTVYEGFVLGVNPFDQFGVELGKVLASGIRDEIRKKNQDAAYAFDASDPFVRMYLDTLFKGRL